MNDEHNGEAHDNSQPVTPIGHITTIGIDQELKQSYLSYAMSVIIGRALPDVRDGLKPVHRRVLYTMHELKNDWNKPYKKSARIVGDTIGKYHPHGEGAVYDALVRMAQLFSLRYPLVDGQGNFGSVDGDTPAAMRYTEVRMRKITHALLEDLEKDTVDFVLNYDESEREPTVLPSRAPQLLINGASGIAVGMATNIPPHNIGEVINATLLLMDNPSADVAELMQVLPGPDFPTAAIINGAEGIREAYATGRGRIWVRAKHHFEVVHNHDAIIIDELPYQVNKARLMERIAELVKLKKVEGIAALRDESDKDGMRMVIEVKRGEVPEVLLNQLYKLSDLQTVFGINLVALVDGKPQVLSLPQILAAFIEHRREVVTRRTIFLLARAAARAHILTGLAVALANIDAIIALIQQSSSPQQASERLRATSWRAENVQALLSRTDMPNVQAALDDIADGGTEVTGWLDDGTYRLDEKQAQAILDLRLHRLTGLEQQKLVDEFHALLTEIGEFQRILDSRAVLDDVLRTELLDIKTQFNDERRTAISTLSVDLRDEDLIADEQRVVVLSHTGYVKTQTLADYSAQRRGGRGKSATDMKESDYIVSLFIASAHQTVLCFSNTGRLYWLRVYELPFASRNARGRPIVNLLPITDEEKITSVLPVREFVETQYVFMATRRGYVKKTPLSAFARPRKGGIIACDFVEDDSVISVALTGGDYTIVLFTRYGQSIRFAEGDVRPMGRTARGVIGIRLADGDEVVAMLALPTTDGEILTVTEHGYGKRTGVDEYRCQRRGGSGLIAVKTSERNGALVGAIAVAAGDETMIITDAGTLIRTYVDDIAVLGRNTQGVRLIRVGDGEVIRGIARVPDDAAVADGVDGEMTVDD